MPELRFEFDKSVEHQDRIERILLDLQAERDARGPADPDPTDPTDPTNPEPDEPDEPENLTNPKKDLD